MRPLSLIRRAHDRDRGDYLGNFFSPSESALLREFQSLPRLIDRLFEMPQQTGRAGDEWFSQMSRAAAADFVEDKDKFVVRVDLPGVPKEAIDVAISQHGEDYLLKISGERKDEVKGDKETSSRYGKFHHTVSLPINIKADGVSAKYVLGVLTISVPKVEVQPQKEARKVAIE